MLKIKDNVDLKWLMYKYELDYALHCDMPGKYLFYDDTLYIDPTSREIIIEEETDKHNLFLKKLEKSKLVEKVEKIDE
jgi:folate-binding Fe-S cluster repair protein YgfZ